ncbi:MAG: polysaccharide biosynthesis/export family protein [Prevotella sp.]
MKKLIRLALVGLVLVMALALDSCSTSKGVAYFQNADSVSLAASKVLYDAKIMPKDQLTITVNTTNPEAAAPFNLSVSATVGTSGQLNSGGGSSLQGYLVDNDGYINFPIVGKLHVAGLTKNECEDMIRSKIKPYMSTTENPIVTVRMASYRVTVLGEVKSPGVVQVPTEKMSVLEAIAQAGDLTIYGKRNNVMLIREAADGEKSIHRLNLNDANLINSPYYYLQQNDILYVQPNSVQAKNSAIGSSTTVWFSLVSIVTSVASLLVNVLRK